LICLNDFPRRPFHSCKKNRRASLTLIPTHRSPCPGFGQPVPPASIVAFPAAQQIGLTAMGVDSVRPRRAMREAAFLTIHRPGFVVFFFVWPDPPLVWRPGGSLNLAADLVDPTRSSSLHSRGHVDLHIGRRLLFGRPCPRQAGLRAACCARPAVDFKRNWRSFQSPSPADDHFSFDDLRSKPPPPPCRMLSAGPFACRALAPLQLCCCRSPSDCSTRSRIGFQTCCP